jgi:hypothetical protein
MTFASLTFSALVLTPLVLLVIDLFGGTPRRVED